MDFFQCNPDRFDVDGYLSFAPERIAWQVNQSWNQIAPGDQVFLWRARGTGQSGEAAIVAECTVDSHVTEMEEEPESRRFWRGVSDFGRRRRVWLRVVRVAEPRHALFRDRIAAEPPLSAVGPIGFGNATNFLVKPEESSPLNLLWQQSALPRTAETIREDLEAITARLEQQTLQQLMDEYERRRRENPGVDTSRRSRAVAVVFERDPYVRAIARKRANFRCEIPDCPFEPFLTASGEPYCEVHHIVSTCGARAGHSG